MPGTKEGGFLKKVITYIIITAFLFGTMEIALKIGGSAFDPLQLTFLRFFIGGLVLAPVGIAEARRHQIRISTKEFIWLLLVGIMGIAISMLCFQLGVERCNAATAAALMCLNPLFTMVIAHIFTSEKMDRAKGIAFAIGIMAAVFMIRPWDVQEGNTVLGMILMLVATTTFAAYTVMGKRTISRLGTFTQTSLSFILGSLALLVVIAATGRPVVRNITVAPLELLYCGVVVTGLGYMFYFLAIKYSDATTGSIAFFIKPAIAPVLAVLILHETVYWNTIVGIALLIGASIITLRDTWKNKDTSIEATEEHDRETFEKVREDLEKDLEHHGVRGGAGTERI